jgi:hypothetical protein
MYAQSSLTELVDPDREFYEVLSTLPDVMSDWVLENVIPNLGKTGITPRQFQEKLEAFLSQHQVQELHYDWCEDIAYFNRVLVTGPGERLKIPTTQKVNGKAVAALAHIHHTDIEATSKVAHNALHDARAIALAIRRRLLRVE